MTDDFTRPHRDAAEAAVPSAGVADTAHASMSASATDDPIASSLAGGLPTQVATGIGGDTIRYSAAQLKSARGVLTRLSALRRAARFYPMDHPAVADAVGRLSDAIHVYHDQGVDVQLAFFEGEILLGSQVLAEESMLFDQLDRDMRAIGIGSIVFRVGISGAELMSASRILSADVDEAAAAGGVSKMAAEANLPHVQFASVHVLATTADEHESGEPTETPREAMSSALALLRETDLLLQNDRQVSAARVNGVVRSLVDNVLANRYAMLQLTALRNYDEYTFYHSANVAVIALALGSCVSEDHRFLSSLGSGALLHDIGKLTIDPGLLNKPGPLTPEEWTQVRQHPISGAEMVAQLPGLDRSAIVTILEHHMRWDGSGYPSRTPRKPQHLCSRIVAIADAYDAMTSRRSYSAARVEDDAMLNIAQGADTAFDPALVRLFVAMMGLFPPRSAVRLSTGAVAIVLAADAVDPGRPVVRVITNPDGEFIAPEDLALGSANEVSVVACLDPQLLNVEVDDYL
jgi:HD-GYP domain-containing protein (c-di-GMP phosphodiesterase class II)